MTMAKKDLESYFVYLEKKKLVFEIIKKQDIYFYCDLVVYLKNNDFELYHFVTKYPALFDRYLNTKYYRAHKKGKI